MSPLSRRRLLASAGALGLGPLASRGAGPAPEYDLRKSQLFLADTWVEESSRLQRTWCSAEILPEPVLKPEAPWEGIQIVMFGSVFRLEGEWRMYYLTYNRPEPMLFCMATSRDGLRWERPNLGLVDFRGSKANNILWMPAAGESNDGPTICHDPDDPRAAFKMMYYGFGGKRTRGEYVAFSKDGITWEHRAEPVLANTGDRTNVMPVRDRDGRYVAFLRHREMMTRDLERTVWRSESRDFLHWTDPERILRPDLLDDANTELYGMAAFPYEDIYLGMLERWYDNPDVIEVQLAFSRDGRQWQRPAVRQAFIGPKYPWNKGWNSCANTVPVRVENQLWFYFGGRSAAHAREAPRSYGAIGLATTGVDQFAAIRADFIEGRLITKPMTWPGGDLVLRCTNTRYSEAHPTSGGGSIAVEVRDEGNMPIPGFSGEQRARHDVVSPKPWQKEEPPVHWAGARSLSELKGRRIRLVFFMRDARLFSFRARENDA
jgi:hypothetical protein